MRNMFSTVRRGLSWLIVLTLQLTVFTGTAFAASSACTALSALDTTSYSNSFPASSFASGESVTVTYSDDGGDTSGLPVFATDRVRIQDTNQTNLYGYNYDSSSRVAGLHSVTITSGQLTATGLNLIVSTGTHIGTVSIRCSGAVSPPTVANTLTSVASNSANNNVTLSITGTVTSVAVMSGASHGTAIASGTSISYTPAPGYYGTDSFTYSASNSSGPSGTATANITVTAGTLTMSPAAGALPPTAVGAAYSQSFSASGGTTPYSYSATGLPAGLTLNASTGALSGTPTAAQSNTFTIQAADSSNGAGGPLVVNQSYTLNVAAPTVTISPSTLTSPAAGVAFGQTLAGGGGAAPYSFAITAGALPAGLSINATTGTISGTPTAAGAFSFTVTSTDRNGFSGNQAYSGTVTAPTIAFLTNTVSAAAVGTAYSQTLTAMGGTAPYTFSLTGGTLPAGLMLSSNGVLSGTPLGGGTYNFTVQARDSTTGGVFTGSQTFTLSVNAAALSVAPATLAGATVGVPYAQAITASGGTAPYSYGISAGSLPAGMSLAPGGQLSGTPTAGGTFNFTVIATDSSGGLGPYSGTLNYTLSVSGATLSLSPTTLPAPTVGVAYGQTLSASGGVAPYTYAVSAGALPAGLSLNAATGVISGTPTSPSASTFTIRVTDSSTGTGAPSSATRTFTLSASQAVPTAPAVTLGTKSNAAVTIHAAANAANGPFTGVVIVTPPSSGTAAVQGLDIVYTPAAASSGAITFTYALQNGAGQSAPIPVTINVAVVPTPVALAQASVAAGKDASVNVTQNATGGPFTGAAIGV